MNSSSLAILFVIKKKDRLILRLLLLAVEFDHSGSYLALGGSDIR